MKVKCVYSVSRANRNQELHLRIPGHYSRGKTSIQEACQAAPTSLNGNAAGSPLDEGTGEITIRDLDEMFVVVGGRSSIIDFLTAKDNQGFKFKAPQARELGLIICRRRELFIANKTAVAVCLVDPNPNAANHVSPISGVNIGGIGRNGHDLDPSGKTLSMPQLIKFLHH